MSKTVNISIPEELLKRIDQAAKGEYASRSDYIRETLVRELKGQRIVNEWGDQGQWQTVTDFTSIDKNGVPLDSLLSAIETLEK